jgi:hypothetical protein
MLASLTRSPGTDFESALGGRGHWGTMPVREAKKRWQAAANRIP